MRGFAYRSMTKAKYLMKTLKFNHAAIWVAIVLSQVIPLGWYAIFADRWQTLNDLTDTYIEANQGNWLFVISLLAGVAAIYLLAWIFRRLPVTNAQSGLVIGIVIGGVFNMASLITINMFSFRPLELAFIDGGANVLVYGVAGLILGAWRKYDNDGVAEPADSEVELTGSSQGTTSPRGRP